MRELYRKYEGRAEIKFLIVEQKEPHAGHMAFKHIAQPQTFEQRCILAQRMKDEFELPMDVLVDTMADESRELFTDLPSPAFVINRDGTVAAKFPWAEAGLIATALEQIDAGR